MTEMFDMVVVGGGPSGATAANDLALAGHKVMLLDRTCRWSFCAPRPTAPA
jgi:geranylgeranyl reductase